MTGELPIAGTMPDFSKSSGSKLGDFKHSRRRSVARHLDAAPSPHGKSRARMSGGGKGENNGLVGMDRAAHCSLSSLGEQMVSSPLKHPQTETQITCKIARVGPKSRVRMGARIKNQELASAPHVTVCGHRPSNRW